jgi:soluble lytic murein transglycosylase-like protein
MAELSRQLWLSAPLMRGDDVLSVQRRLAVLGFAVRQDGLYGRATEDAVSQFQSREGLKSDSLVGAATWHALFQDAAAGNRGDASPQRPARPISALAEILTKEKLEVLKKEHQRFRDGCKWSISADGLKVEKAEPSESEKQLAGQVLDRFAHALASGLAEFPVPVELIIACICTESSGKPDAQRPEPGCDRKDPEQTPGRVSMGLMQTLLSTARIALHDRNLALSALRDPVTSIRAGAAYMWRQGLETSFDPPLAAAAYNAGSIRYNGSSANRWKLLQYPIGTSQHCDRFVLFFNAAIKLPGIDQFPNLRSLLQSAPTQ